MESYWNVADVAAAVKMSVQTVYRYVANGEIPFHKLNRAVRFKPSEIESWLESLKAGFLLEARLPVANNEKTNEGLFAEKLGLTEAADRGGGNV